jgi:4-methylaminobutanoate oxidase (formaldehyde-forming)
VHWPFKQHKTSRNIKLTPYHEELKEAGACFGVSGGYERPMWFALNGDKAEYEYSYNYQNWYPSAEYETNNTVTNVGLFDLTPFSKYEIKSKNAHQELQRICTSNIKNEIGRSTYTHMLNKDGGIETDLTVICIDENYFRIISSAATRERDKFHIKKNLTDEIELSDVTDDYCVLGLFGPKSRNLISKISNDDFTNEKFKFGNGKFITIGTIKVWAQRMSYVGELGFEIYVEKNEAKEVYQLIVKEGKKHNLSLSGSHAMDILRMESGFLHWGHDISPEENQYEAGLNFAISYKKEIDFIGRKSLLKIKDKKQKKNFIMLSLKNSKPGAPLLLHDEPIYLDNKIIGRTTSGNYSFNYSKNLSFGYVETEYSNKELKNKNLYIEVAKEKYLAMVEVDPLKDKVARSL